MPKELTIFFGIVMFIPIAVGLMVLDNVLNIFNETLIYVLLCIVLPAFVLAIVAFIYGNK